MTDTTDPTPGDVFLAELATLSPEAQRFVRLFAVMYNWHIDQGYSPDYSMEWSLFHADRVNCADFWQKIGVTA